MSNQDVFNIGEYEYRCDIMQRIQNCFQTAIEDHCKVFVVRLDVRFPQGFPHDGKNTHLSELLRRMQMHYGRERIDCRYVWVREQNKSVVPHNHLLLLLDGSRVENGWGVKNEAARIWSVLMKVNCDACINLSRPQGSGGIMIRRPSSRSEGEKLLTETKAFEAAYHAAYGWAGYLAKTYTKGGAPLNVREFGSSRF